MTSASTTTVDRVRRARRPTGSRPRVSMVAVGAGAALLAIVMLGVGDYALTPGEVLDALSGTGFDHRVVIAWRAPREVACLVGGAALGCAGWIFQSITRNPLGSPDVIGVSSGSFVGVLLALLIVPAAAGGGSDRAMVGGSVGAAAAAALVFGIAQLRRRTGSAFGVRLVLVGVAIGGMLQAVASWLLLISKVEVGQAASVWAFGTLTGVRWGDLVLPTSVIAALAVGAALLVRPLRILELGDDVATALGIGVGRLRVVALAVGVLLVAAVAAFAGPIAFVALVAPHLARLIRGTHAGALSSAVTGAALFVAADVIAQRTFAPTQLPVGLVTLCIGGVFLIALLLSNHSSSIPSE